MADATQSEGFLAAVERARGEGAISRLRPARVLDDGRTAAAPEIIVEADAGADSTPRRLRPARDGAE